MINSSTFCGWIFFYNPENAGLVADYDSFLDIPDDLILSYYDGVYFVPEDFAN